MSSESAGRLLVCATPIGNLGDTTLRVLEAFRAADLVAAEDTRVTRKLLARYGIDVALERCDQHSVERQAPLLVARMLEGETIAFASDAGTPGLSDPGARLISAAIDAGVVVEALPGASALLAALVVSGLPMRRFFFGGFLPRKAGERRRELEALAHLDATLVFYESPNRTAASLKSLAEVLPGRDAVLARELTKLYEEVLRGSIESLAEEIARRGSLKGEVVLMVGPPAKGADRLVVDADAIAARVEELVFAGASRSAAVKQVAHESGVQRSEVYDIAHGTASDAQHPQREP